MPSGFAKGHPRYGGKQKGSKNKSTLEREQQLVELLVAEQLTSEQFALLEPLDTMLRIMRSRYQAGDEIGALQAAAFAAPYRHAPELEQPCTLVAA